MSRDDRSFFPNRDRVGRQVEAADSQSVLTGPVPPNASGGTVTFWNYPAGGFGTKTIGGLVEPAGATVSNGE
jgi:hypothetical protein